MIPVWLKNKKTGGYDLIPYDIMLRGDMICEGRQVWYVHTINFDPGPGSETLDRFRVLNEMVDQHPEYFMQVFSGTYLFTGKKWGIINRLINYIGMAMIWHHKVMVYALGVVWTVALVVLLASVATLLYHLFD